MKSRAYLLVVAFLAMQSLGRAQASPAAPLAAKPTPAAASADLTPAATANISKRVEAFLRNLYAWGPTFDLKVGPIKPAPIADMYEVTVQVTQNNQSDTATVYVTKDARFIFRGEIQDLTQDPLAAVRTQLHLEGAASKGPANAKIVVVEFGDFECPICRQLDMVLRTEMPKYPQVRFVFKDFPLEEVHPWAQTAALAGRCALQKNQDTFWKLHDAIYDNQDLISPENAFEKLTDLATQAGIAPDQFKACMADPKTAAAVQASLDEGQNLDVNSTPTVFVDGRRLIGPSDTVLEQYIDFDLHRTTTPTPAR